MYFFFSWKTKKEVNQGNRKTVIWDVHFTVSFILLSLVLLIQKAPSITSHSLNVGTYVTRIQECSWSNNEGLKKEEQRQVNIERVVHSRVLNKQMTGDTAQPLPSSFAPDVDGHCILFWHQHCKALDLFYSHVWPPPRLFLSQLMMTTSSSSSFPCCLCSFSPLAILFSVLDYHRLKYFHRKEKCLWEPKSVCRDLSVFARFFLLVYSKWMDQWLSKWMLQPKWECVCLCVYVWKGVRSERWWEWICS